MEFQQGIPLALALAEKRIDLDAPMLVTVNGKLIDKWDTNRFMLSDGDEIKVMPVLSGG